MTPQPIDLLQAMQDSEINFQIETFWDIGFVMKLGDDLNGIKAERVFRNEDGGLAKGINWLIGQAFSHYPQSEFTRNYG